MQQDVQAAISAQVRLRQRSLQEEMEKTLTLHLLEREAAQKRLTALETELRWLDSQIGDQAARVGLAELALSRHRALVEKGYVSVEQLQQKNETLLDQRSRRQALERERTGILCDRGMPVAELAVRQASA